MGDNAKNVIKRPVWLKRYIHTGWLKSKPKWKALQTEISVAAYLGRSPDDELAIVTKIAQDEAMPEYVRVGIFRRYRRERDLDKKGRTVKKNVKIIDPFGTVRDQLTESVRRPTPPITIGDIAAMAAQTTTDAD